MIFKLRYCLLRLWIANILGVTLTESQSMMKNTNTCKVRGDGRVLFIFELKLQERGRKKTTSVRGSEGTITLFIDTCLFAMWRMGSGRRPDIFLRIRGKEKKRDGIHRQFADCYSEEGHKRLHHYIKTIMVGMWLQRTFPFPSALNLWAGNHVLKWLKRLKELTGALSFVKLCNWVISPFQR